jgi:hypothetical protein
MQTHPTLETFEYNEIQVAQVDELVQVLQPELQA